MTGVEKTTLAFLKLTIFKDTLKREREECVRYFFYSVLPSP